MRQHDKLSRHLLLLSSGPLISPRSLQTDAAACDLQNQITLRGQMHRLSSLKTQSDLPRVGARSHFEVVLQMSLPAVIHQVNSGINAAIAHPRKLRNVAMPLGRIISNKVIARPRKRFDAADLRIYVRAVKPHTNCRGFHC